MVRRSGLTFQYACLLGLPTMAYGLIGGAAAMARVDGNHWPDVLAGAAWAGGLMFLLGALVGGLSALPVAIAIDRSSEAPRWAGVLQTAAIVLFGGWLYLNHQVMLKTDDPLTAGAVKFLFSNPKEVLDMAWRFAGYHLLGLVLAIVLGFALLLSGFGRLNRRLMAQNASVCDGPRPLRCLMSFLTRCRPVQPIGIAMGALLLVPAALLALQVSGHPSRSLVTTARVFPPFRAFQLTRWLTRPVIDVEPPPQQGAPVVSEEEYSSSCRIDRGRLRNVVFIVLESVPAKALHCYGYPRDVSPHMDRMAADGVQLDHCYAAASFSSYSLVSTFTSLYMLRSEENDHFRRTDFHHVGIHDVLKRFGYELTLFSSGNESWDNLEAFCPPAMFDVYFSHNRCNLDKTDCNRMDDKYAMGEFAKWLAGRPADRPFYTYINLQGTHFNYEVPEPWASRYKPLPPPYSNGDGVIHIPLAVVPLLKNQYDNALGYVDHWVGTVRSLLEQHGQLERSIIVVVGDHGEAFMEHGLARHGMHLWNEMIQVPGIILAPGLLAPRRVDKAVSQIDLVPTVMALMGVPAHPAWQGVNILEEGYDDRTRPVFSILQLTRSQEALILSHTKYIADQDTREEWLFDLSSDPDERHNLADPVSPSPILQKVRRLLAEWHGYQLAYYGDAARRRTHYVGLPNLQP
jgi:arylsulfatase A-like enzyme